LIRQKIIPEAVLKKFQKIMKDPIIDMHIHAYSFENPMFGLEYKNPLTGKIYYGSASLQSK
jgi:hypothetical protein